LALPIAVSSFNISFAETITESEDTVISVEDEVVSVEDEVVSDTAIDISDEETEETKLNLLDTNDNIVAYPVDGGNIYFDTSTGTVKSCDESVISANIPDKINNIDVKYIGPNAFNSCTNITQVTIPNTVKTIGSYAFTSCSNLTKVSIPDGVTSIYNSAFENCSSLTEISIPNSVTNIGNEAFRKCSSLISVSLSNNLTSINRNAFNSCSSLKEIIIPDGVTYIDYNAFEYCSSLVEVSIPNSVIGINSHAFGYCTSLIEVSIPEGVTYIGPEAFVYCYNLTKLTIPNSVESIGDSAFSICSSLTDVDIPDSVIKIGDSAFAYCSNIKNINIPDSVTKIGEYAFGSCFRLKNVTLSKNLEIIESYTFSGCTLLENIVIPEGITTINDYAFLRCDSLSSIKIPKSVTSISKDTFSRIQTFDRDLTIYCYKDSVVDDIDLYTDNYNIEMINIKYLDYENPPNYTFTEINEIAYPVEGGNIYFNPETGEITNCDLSVTKADIPTKINNIPVTSIGKCAFRSIGSLSEIKIPSSVKEIKLYGIAECYYGLKKIEIDTGLEIIGGWAFCDDNYLESINIPDGVKKIGPGAFDSVDYDLYDKSNFSTENCCDIVIPASVESIGYSAFDYAMFKNITFLGIDTVIDPLRNAFDENNVYCYKGSFAEEYCIENNKSYTLLADSTDNVIGDINGDGVITTKDAVTILQMATGKVSNNLLADVNGDGKITTKDAVLILQYSTGKISSF
jgi:hypothetical protein